MKVLGLVGGVASGKSLVARQLESLGAVVLDADRIGHQVLGDGDVIAAIRQRWGDELLDASGQVDRRRLAAIVFGPEGRGELEYLERLTHPRIAGRIETRLAAATGPVVLDAAVMLKGGWDRWCDEIWFVDTPQEMRLARARERGWTEKEWLAREAAQGPIDLKRARASRVIDNSGTPEQTLAQVARLWPAFMA